MARRRLKKSVVRKIRLVVIAIFVVLSCILYNYIFKMNIVPSKYLKLVFLGLLVLNLIGTLLFKIRGKISKVFGFLIYAVLLIICILGIRYSSITIKFLNRAFKTKKEIVVYDVIVPKDSKYNELNELDGKKMGRITIDTNN